LHSSSHSLQCSFAHPDSPSFPTRRSSDLPNGTSSVTIANGGAAQINSGTQSALSLDLGNQLVFGGNGKDKLISQIQRQCRLCSRSEEHTSELQSRRDLVCRLLLEKKKKDQ